MKEILEMYLYFIVPVNIFITLFTVLYWIRIYRYFRKNSRIAVSGVFNRGREVFSLYGVTALLLSLLNIFGINIAYNFFSYDHQIFYLVYSSITMSAYLSVVGFVIGSRKLVKYIEKSFI